MARSRWERWAALTGVATVVLWVLGIFVVEGAGEQPDDTPQDILRYFEQEEASIYIGGLLLFGGSLLLIWFGSVLWAAIRTAEGPVARTATLVFGAIVAKAVFDIAFFATQIAGAFGANEADEPLTPEAAQALWYAGDGFFVAAEFAGALVLAAVAVAILKTRVLPAWLAWVGLVLAVVMLVPPIGWAGLLFGFPLWLLIASVLLFLRQPSVDVTYHTTLE